MLVLASNSPRRKQLLQLGGWEFQVVAAHVDENPHPGEGPRAYVLRLAKEKAQVGAQNAPGAEVVVAADTTVVDGVAFLGKPVDAAEAAAMLRRLRARRHQVYTGLVALRRADGLILSDVCVTNVFMRDYSEAEIKAYIATGDPLDKAGAYAIQHTGFDPVEKIEGCFANVVGLPLCLLSRLLAKLGLPPPAKILEPYLKDEGQPCLITNQVLQG
ncbi:MAG TPA: Maf family protein [Anaerolineales bacterium]|nr:Maf family protein [Anaerolineales bacterium]